MITNLKVDLSNHNGPSKVGGMVSFKVSIEDMEILNRLAARYSLPKSTIAYRCLKALLNQEEADDVSGN